MKLIDKINIIKKGTVLVFDGNQSGLCLVNAIGVAARDAKTDSWRALPVELTEIGIGDIEITKSSIDSHFGRLHNLGGILRAEHGWNIQAKHLRYIISCSFVGNIIKLKTGELLSVTPSGYINIDTLEKYGVLHEEDIEEIRCRDVRYNGINNLSSMEGISFVATKELIEYLYSYGLETKIDLFSYIS